MVMEALYTTGFCNVSVQAAEHLTGIRPSSNCSFKYIFCNVRNAISASIKSCLRSQSSSYAVWALCFLFILLPSIKKIHKLVTVAEVSNLVYQGQGIYSKYWEIVGLALYPAHPVGLYTSSHGDLICNDVRKAYIHTKNNFSITSFLMESCCLLIFATVLLLPAEAFFNPRS